MIPFNKPYMTGRELECISQAHAQWHLSGDGPFTQRCNAWLEEHTGCQRALLTHSCTAALEMAALLLDIATGDEVIMPSFTFVSTANAFVLRGGTPVFVDVREDTLNMDESLLEAAITARTKAIVPVHYAGVACEMDAIRFIGDRHGIPIVEDAAQAVMARYQGRPLGSIGALGALSFHETKNVISGEGGAILINDPSLVKRAEVIRQKGTNRSEFYRGAVDKYTWVDVGSSYLPSELIAAFLWAQMESAEALTSRRIAMWNRYHEAFRDLEEKGLLRRPVIPGGCEHNAHMYYVLLRSAEARQKFIATMKAAGILTVFHYVPLHDSPAGRRFGHAAGDLRITRALSDRLVRLPMWVGLEPHLEIVIDRARSAIVQ